MLWVLLALYLFGSSGISDHFTYIERIRSFVKAEVRDSARRADILATVNASEKMIKERIDARKKIVTELSKISERYESKAADMQPVLDRYRAETAAYQELMIKYRFELRGKMTRNEWAKVFPVERPQQVTK